MKRPKGRVGLLPFAATVAALIAIPPASTAPTMDPAAPSNALATTAAPGVDPPPIRARWKRGAISPEDYPPGAMRDRAGGIVYLRFVVGPSGRLTECKVTKSSGRADLDETTCRLLQRRLRFRPARNAAGEAVADVFVGEHVWEIRQRKIR